MEKRKLDTKKLTVLAMLAALSFIVMVVGRIPVVLFLKYDPKDVVITIAGFIYGPMSSFLISAVVSVVEMFTVSDTGPWGLLMNVLATCAFACPAAYIYKKRHDQKGAMLGLGIGVVLMVAVMLLWNYLITPYYMGYPRAAVAELLIPAFLPFNLLKGGINAAVTMLLYKPVVTALRRAGLVPKSQSQKAPGKNWGALLVSLVVLITCVLFVLVMKGII